MTKNNYRRLGDYIKKVDVRNTEDLDIPLLGVSVQKLFIPSIANTVGTNFEKYKIAERNQFVYIPDTSRRGDKIGVALLKDYDKALISQAYTVFEILDHTKLIPDYLMMWFARPEFDRYARFHSIGSVREVFDWTDLCDVELPIPSIEKQREIVADYLAVENKIKTNEAICEKLEETAQTIYRRWFEDFEFPDKDGKPYKSNGGKMVWNEELEKEIPEGWEAGTLEDIYKFQYGKGNTNPHNNGEYPVFGSNGIIGGYHKFNSEDAPVIGHIGINAGIVIFAYDKHFVTYNGVICKLINFENKWFSYLTLKSIDLMSQTRGSSQPFVSYDMLYENKVMLPHRFLTGITENWFERLFRKRELLIKENQKLHQLQSLLLGRMTNG